MFVLLQRPVLDGNQNDDTTGEDDGIVNLSQRLAGRPFKVNPFHVAAYFPSDYDQSICIVRLRDGRGFKVIGSFEQIDAMLDPAPVEPPLMLEPPRRPHRRTRPVPVPQSGEENNGDQIETA